MSELKQVIVIRHDLHMRQGKSVAQGSHASLGAFMAALDGNSLESNTLASDWYYGLSKKICVRVDSLEDLLDLREKAVSANLPNHLVLDAGLTEFKEPTFTALAIGPAPSELIDPITRSLKLL